MVRNIGIAGYESEDIAFYLAMLIQKLGRIAILVDETIDEQIFQIAGEAKKENEAWYGDLKIVKEVSNEKVEADILLHVYGDRSMNETCNLCDYLVMVTDMTMLNARRLRCFENWKGKRVLVLKNYLELKYEEDYLCSLIGQEFEEIFMLPFDERNLRERCYLQTDGVVRFRKLSREMKLLLEGILRRIEPEWKAKEIRKRVLAD